MVDNFKASVVHSDNSIVIKSELTLHLLIHFTLVVSVRQYRIIWKILPGNVLCDLGSLGAGGALHFFSVRQLVKID